MGRCRVLLAWEQGRNFGHLARLAALAQLFERTGAEIVWALPPHVAGDCSFVRPWHSIHAVPVPRWIQTQSHAVPNSFADIIAAVGFASSTYLRAAVQAWIRLFETQGIDRVVLDYAPTAQLAACIAGVPAHQITNGFDAPPANFPTFGLGLRGPMMEQRNRDRIDSIDRALAEVAEGLGVRSGFSLKAWLAYPARWYDCIPDMDPYGPRNDGAYVGPVGRPAMTLPVEWPNSCGAKKVFVYMRSEHQLRLVLDALRAREACVICSCPGISPEAIKRSADERIALVDRAVDLGRVLLEADAVVNYGSSAVVCQSLLAGKPQLMLPTDTEKWLVARRVHGLGAGVMPSPDWRLKDAFAAVWESHAIRARAEDIGRRGRAVLGRLERDVRRIGSPTEHRQ